MIQWINFGKSFPAFFKDSAKSVHIDFNYSNEKFEKFIEGFKTYIEEKDISQALKKLNDLKVLCAVREGEFGLYALNEKIQKTFAREKINSNQHSVLRKSTCDCE